MEKERVRFFMLFIVCLLSVCGKAGNPQVAYKVYAAADDKEVFRQYIEAMKPARTQPVGELMVRTARFFLGTPYVASTLENEPEGVTVHFAGLDCATLVDNTTALVQTLQADDPSFDVFTENLFQIRYRSNRAGNTSAVLDYTDRLHYTSDWIYENCENGRVKDVTREIGGKPLLLNLDFMSTHPDSYKQLKASPERLFRIAAKEKEINARSYYYIPKEEIAACASGIQEGDIICFVTSIKGLDISHVAIAIRVNGELTFIHASSTAQKVIVNEATLIEYVKKIKSNIGIMVVRPLVVAH